MENTNPIDDTLALDLTTLQEEIKEFEDDYNTLRNELLNLETE
jgi:hypothetical protein